MRKRVICTALLLALHCGFAHAQPPLPEIAIGSCPELQAINSNLSGDYYLANDIDCTGFDFGDGKGFMPIGDGDTPFTGTFDGKGFTVSNVFIDRPAMSRVGVFGFAGKTDGTDGADISHVTVSDFDITGQGAVGSLFGAAYYSNFEDVHSSGSVTGVTMIIGGLGGTSRYSTITNASSSGSVIGDQSGSTSMIFYGGLLGSNERSDLSCSSSDADVIGNYRVGGLVGNNSGTITTSFATGAVQGFYRVGGLAGENISGTIADCFATGDVSGFSGSHELGGLVGLQYRDSVYADGSEPVIRNSYATGSVTGGYNMQGILGLRMNGTCSGTYWDVMTSGITSDSCGSSGLTTSEMRNQSSYIGWDFNTVWTINGDYPELQCTPASSVEHTVTSLAGTGGSISPDNEQTVNQGSTVSFTVLSDLGYKIDKVEGCGGTLSGNIYTTAPITDDCEVTASFTPYAGRNGMTWGVNRYNNDLDITRVHCYGQVGPNRGPCDPYQGDTACSINLPVLCVKVDGRPRPPYAIPTCSACAMNDEYYNGWAEGIIGLTAPVQGDAFATLDDVNAYCEEQLGPGYRVAEHHDGRLVYGMDENNFYGATWPLTTSSGGWGFYAPGQLADDSRFWVHINDQNANCWGSNTEPKGSIGDQVWADPDEDGNGLLDGDDYPLAGVNMRLYDSGGNLVRETETYVNGKYLFSNLDYGTYSVEIDQTSLPSNMQGNIAYAPAASVTIDASSPNNNGQDFAVYESIGVCPRPASAQEFTLSFDSLPSVQGWQYYSQNDGSEADWSVNGDILSMTTLGLPYYGSNHSGATSLYRLDNIVDPHLDYTLEVRARCLEQEGTTWHYWYGGGFHFGAYNGNYACTIAVSPDRLRYITSDGPVTVASWPDDGMFRNFRVEGTINGQCIIYVDDVLVSTQSARSLSYNRISLGDSTNPTNAAGEITYYRFSQGGDVCDEYTVTPSAGANGTISPDSPQSVEHGDTTSFTVTPDTGYSIDKVEGCNGSLSGNTYTTGAITADCEVTAGFAININTTGQIVVKNYMTDKDVALFKMTGMADIGSVARDAADSGLPLTFGFGSEGGAAIYSFTADSFDAAGNRLIYSDSDGNMLRCLFSTKQCVVRISYTDFDKDALDALLTGEMNVRLDIGKTVYSDTGVWKQLDSGSGSWTKYRKDN